MAISVRILPIVSVGDVPQADRLSVVRVLGFDAVVTKNPDGSHRYAPGDRVVYIPEGSLLPDRVLRDLGFWRIDPETGIETGTLSGPRGAVVKPHVMRKQLTTGIIVDVPEELQHLPDATDVAEHYGIREWIPPVPDALLRIALSFASAKTEYVIPRLKMYPDFFRPGEEVVATEKLEGENLQMTWMGGHRHEGLFGDGRIAVTTKGMGLQGLVFRDVEDARRVPIIRGMEKADLLDRFAFLVRHLGAEGDTVRLFSEAVGAGVKKLHYDSPVPTARTIDVFVGGRFLTEDERAAAFAAAGMERVPVLYRGGFGMEMVEGLREGRTTIGGKHDREGVVVTAVGDQSLRLTSLGDSIRPSLKYHSDRFLRKFGIED